MNSRVIDVEGYLEMGREGQVQCESCKEWWPEDSPDAPSESDECPVSMCLCRECRKEVLES